MAQQWNKAFYDRIIADIRETIIDDCVKLMYERMKDMVYLTVYNEFDPVMYKRRYDDKGLGDMGLYAFNLDVRSNGFTITMFTNAKGVGVDKGEDLDRYIVDGLYTYPSSPKPRDFYKATLNSLISDGVLYNILTTKLKAKGINVR